VHELAICESVLRQVLAVAEAHHARRVGRIRLTIGPLAGVEPHLLLHAFPLAAAGTLCAAATVEIETAAVRVECTICGASSDAKPNRLLCAACGSWRVALTGGDEMLLQSVELFETKRAQQGSQIHV
jgi:hydrogenase nickel incorporation protein HypA/HybF